VTFTIERFGHTEDPLTVKNFSEQIDKLFYFLTFREGEKYQSAIL